MLKIMKKLKLIYSILQNFNNLCVWKLSKIKFRIFKKKFQIGILLILKRFWIKIKIVKLGGL